MAEEAKSQALAIISVKDITMRYGLRTIQQNLSFDVKRGDIFIIMGGSGCGKSTMLRHMIGLHRPDLGKVMYNDRSFWEASSEQRAVMMRMFGVMYQNGALWTSMTLAENISLVLRRYTRLSSSQIRQLCAVKLAMVGLAGFEDYYPSEISGGMKKRASIARALALDPEILFLDEPSAGLDPISSRRLDELILELRDNLGTTLVIVTHELQSILAIGSNSVFLDAETKTAIAFGDPKLLLQQSSDPRVIEFLTRGNGGKLSPLAE